MRVVLTNKSSIFVPLYSDDGEGVAVPLQPDTPFALEDEKVLVAIIGHKANFVDNIKEGLGTLVDLIKDLITKWLGQPKEEAEPNSVQVQIENRGANAIRVILGDGVTDYNVDPYASYLARADGYVELRELGNSAGQGGTPK